MIFSCCWEVASVTFSESPPMLTSTVRPVRKANLRTATTRACSPSGVPNWATSQPATSPSPLAPLRCRPGGKRADRDGIHAKQLGVQLPGEIRPFLCIAVCRRQHLQDQLVYVRHTHPSDDPILKLCHRQRRNLAQPAHQGPPQRRRG